MLQIAPRTFYARKMRPPAAHTIGVRSEGMTVMPLANASPSTAHVTGRIQRIEHISDERHLHLQISAAGQAAPFEMVTLCHDLSGLHAGGEVAVRFTAPLFFDAAGQRLAA